MNEKSTANPDSAIAAVVQALDLAVVDWHPDGAFQPLSMAPRWFTGTVPWSSLPFIEHFVDEARRYLHDHLDGVIVSDQFTVQSHTEELLLRARALKVGERLVLVIERLEGGADVRPVLRQARQQALDMEGLRDQARAIHAPLDAVARTVGDLQRVELSDAQKPLVETLSRALTTLQDAAAKLPPPRTRR